MKTNALNHVSITAVDLDVSAAFYETLFDLEVIPSMRFSVNVRWLRVGDLELHLVQSDLPTPVIHHFALVVDDFNEAYEQIERAGVRVRDHPVFDKVYALPDGAVHMYVRDPAGNLIEVLHPDVTTVDPARVPEVRSLEGDVEQVVGSGATLFLEPSGASGTIGA